MPGYPDPRRCTNVYSHLRPPVLCASPAQLERSSQPSHEDSSVPVSHAQACVPASLDIPALPALPSPPGPGIWWYPTEDDSSSAFLRPSPPIVSGTSGPQWIPIWTPTQVSGQHIFAVVHQGASPVTSTPKRTIRSRIATRKPQESKIGKQKRLLYLTVQTRASRRRRAKLIDLDGPVEILQYRTRSAKL